MTVRQPEPTAPSAHRRDADRCTSWKGRL